MVTESTNRRMKKYISIVHGLYLYPDIWPVPQNAQCILHKKHQGGKITQHMKDLQKIKDTQESLMESERLSSLGQLIGGIAHNLKTPIMSIAGAAEGLNDLIKEYDSSIDDPTVNSQDHHEIASDMSTWIEKIKNYTEYMSDIITRITDSVFYQSAIISILTYLRNEVSIKTREAKVKLPAFANAKFIRRSN